MYKNNNNLFLWIYLRFFIISLTFLLFQNMTLICPECLYQISYKNFYHIKQQGKYLSLNAKCKKVVNKIIIYAILFIILLFGIYLNIQSNKNRKRYKMKLQEEYARNDDKLLTNFYNETATTLNWETLIKECVAK